MIKFEWDEEKAEENWREHHISFEQAKQVFCDPFLITEEDVRYDYGERRYWTLGRVAEHYLLLYVAHTLPEDYEEEIIRIISARNADPHERRIYGNRKF